MIEVFAWLKANWLLVALLAILLIAFVWLRNRPSDIRSVEELERLLAAGRPTVIDFYSNF